MGDFYEMIETTVSNLSSFLVNGSIPLTITINTVQSTNWMQFFTTLIIGLFSSFALVIILYGPMLFNGLGRASLKSISRITKKSVVLMKHTESGFFSPSMITEKNLRELSYIMNKLKGKDFDLILHTPGGEIFSSIAISRLIKNYPGRIRAVIPTYSMSGGSLLALSCKEIVMTPNAVIGPIDPQLGSFFKFGSARNWEEVMKVKGKKADDQSIIFNQMGQQYTKSIKNHLLSTIDLGLNLEQKEKFVEFLTNGEVEHAYQLTAKELEAIYGIKTTIINDEKMLEMLHKLIVSKGKEGVKYYEYKIKGEKK